MFAKTLKKKLMMQAAVLAAPLFLVGCSSVPDAANPVEWYRSTVEFFGSDEPEVAKTEDGVETVASEDAEIPEADQKQIKSGFVSAQSSQREYAQPIMRQGEVVNPLSDAEKVEVAEAPKPKASPTVPVQTTQITETQPVSASTQPEAQTRAQAMTQQLIRPQQQVRSVGEVYAANISQTRPLNLDQPMRGTSDTLAFGNDQFETVVVSGTGVARESAGYNQSQPMQFASLTQSAQTSMSDTYSVAMMSEPSVVTEGRAQSMRRFNPSMFAGSFQVATIQFGNGSARLTNEDVRILKEVLNIHQQQGGVIRVVGHASSRTRDMSPDQHQRVNHSVSLGRADKVARQLLKLGMPGEKLFVGGVSDSQPLYQEVMPSGEAGNRRTEIFVDY